MGVILPEKLTCCERGLNVERRTFHDSVDGDKIRGNLACWRCTGCKLDFGRRGGILRKALSFKLCSTIIHET